ncbi:hypothetical protein [Polyangium sp. 6x1]|uniref:hypothetical protein n=1 Tax=Polyangium sp. 6x1 TaxID=3042689 RepID=UPI002482A45A|nr:hypothetical protein [Polyangium sp. 6x1]MDI1448986.1 hypothetical protein [Polyangium sp. 6x1]
MATLDDLLERLRIVAGAEFAFALTREGALVTRDAPREMPEVGRNKLVRLADAVGDARGVAATRLPRGELVPYGGQQPIDICLAVAASRLIICLAMASAEGRPVARAAFEAELGVIEAHLAPREARGAGPSIEVRGPAVLGQESIAAIRRDELVRDAPQITIGPAMLGQESIAAIRRDELVRDAPQITIGPAMLGQESIAAIRLDELVRDAPQITIGPTPTLGRETLAAIEIESGRHDAPHITVEPARKLGRETLAAIEKDIVVSGPPAVPPPIPAAILRQTLPWIDPAIAEKSRDARSDTPEEKT